MATLTNKRSIDTIMLGFDVEGEPDVTEPYGSRRSIIPTGIAAAYERRSTTNVHTGEENVGKWKLSRVSVIGYPRLKSGERGKVQAEIQFYSTLSNAPQWAQDAVKANAPKNDAYAESER